MGCCGPSNHKTHNSKSEPTGNLNSLDLLKIRLARGEISFEEYEKVKAELAK
ncbi:hypothetical protein [Niallia taxi]|uniref:hypothetical protein n=1 Tax=Niallia taxi TaxID=2499688 RepID=UPI002E1F9788|nr:hypothetical protein [Niallia taxi]